MASIAHGRYTPDFASSDIATTSCETGGAADHGMTRVYRASEDAIRSPACRKRIYKTYTTPDFHPDS
jgi:hypothetical protein